MQIQAVRLAPYSTSVLRSCPTSISATPTPERTHCAAAAPAACPGPMTEACTRTDADATASAENDRPATSRFGKPGAIRAAVGNEGRLFEELAPLSGRRGGVDVDRMTSPRNSVGKVDGIEILLARERVETPDAARLAHAGLRGGSEQRGVAEGRHVTAKQFGEEVDVFVQQALRGRRLAVVGHIGLRARHVDEHHPGVSTPQYHGPPKRGYLLPLAQLPSASRMARSW